MITHVTFTGLAGREQERVVPLHPKLSILFGRNGSGKTSLLELLHYGLANNSEQLRRIPFSNFSFRMELGEFAFIRSTSKVPSLFSEREFVPELFTAESRLKTKLPKPEWITYGENLPDAFSVSHVYLPIFRLYESSRRKRTGPVYAPAQDMSDERLDQYFRDVILTTWQGFTRKFLASVGEIQEAGLASILSDVFSSDSTASEDFAEIPDPTRAYEKLSSFLRRRNLFGLNSLTSEEFLRKIETDNFMRRVIRDVEDVEERVEIASESRRNFETLVSEFLGSDKRVIFEDGAIKLTSRSGDVIDISRLSSGEKQLVKIALDTVSADGGPVIIDEPELSLHIDWQRHFLERLLQLSPHSQFIVATHSPDIMAHFSVENIIEI